jgi:glutamyl-tRNA synthetase
MIKSDGSPTYNFSCVVDDSHLEITHVLRGDDHISNTPKQILFYEALELKLPQFGHMPLILGPDGAKLSKRHGVVSVEEYKKEGFLPEALANYLILLGWFPGEDREVLSLNEAVKLFDLDDMSDVQAKFDIQKLKWMNGEYIMKKKTKELLPLIKDRLLVAGFDISSVADDYISKIVGLYKIRMKTLVEFVELADFFFTDDFTVDEEGKKKHLDNEEKKENMRIFAGRLEGLEAFSQEGIEEICRDIVEERGIKAAAVIHPTRMAISGKTKGAGLFEIMEVLGKEKVIHRMKGLKR